MGMEGGGFEYADSVAVPNYNDKSHLGEETGYRVLIARVSRFKRRRILCHLQVVTNTPSHDFTRPAHGNVSCTRTRSSFGLHWFVLQYP